MPCFFIVSDRAPSGSTAANGAAGITIPQVLQMTVELYAGKDPEGRIWEPDFSHEVHAAIRIIGTAWRAFHAAPELYLLAFNLHSPNIDLLVLSERGIGLLEMKAHRGEISIDGEDYWLADGQRMLGYKPVPGKDKPAASYWNPHTQVQGHGERLVERLLPILRDQYPELTRGKRRNLRLQTSVCFTNPEVDVTGLRRIIPEWSRGKLRPWESDFHVLTPEEVPAWISALRFEVKQTDRPPYYPFRMDAGKLNPLLTALFAVERWKSIERMLPVVRYGRLRQVRGEGTLATYSLWEEETLIGRDHTKCTIVVPREYTRVSRIHAAIRREASGIVLEDLDSHNGTYLDGRRISGKEFLRGGSVICLGGEDNPEKEPRYVFQKIEAHQEEMDSTEDGTGPNARRKGSAA
jgi:hypothetical protein